MSDTAAVTRTVRKFAEDLKVGDVVPHALSREQSGFDITLYTVTKIYELRPEDRTMTVEFTYNYGGTIRSRVIGLRRLDFVTAL